MRRACFDELACKNIRITLTHKEAILARIHESDPWYSRSSLASWMSLQLKRRESAFEPSPSDSNQSTGALMPGQVPAAKSNDRVAENSAMVFVVEALHVSSSFLLDLPLHADNASDNMSQMDGFPLKTYHTSLHSRTSRLPAEFEPLPSLIIPRTSESTELQTPSTAVTSPSPFTPSPLRTIHIEPAFQLKQIFVKDAIDIVELSTPSLTRAISACRSSLPFPAEQESSWSELGDLDYPSSEVDPEDFKMEEDTIMPSPSEPKTLSQFLERIGDLESVLDQILELMDCGKHKIQLAVS